MINPDWDEARIRQALEHGEVDWNDPEVRKAAKRMPKLAEELEALRQLESDVDADAADLRAALEEARGQSPTDSDLRQLDSIWEIEEIGARAPLPGPKRTSPWKWVGGLMAAAALVLLMSRGFLPGGGDDPDPGPKLGTAADIELVEPTVQSQSITGFTWQTEVKIGDSFVVTVTETTSGKTHKSPRVSQSSWSPNPPIRATEIQWFVTRYRGGSGSGETSGLMRFSLPE